MPGPHSGPREIDCLNSGGQKQNYLKFSDISSISHFQSPVNHRYLIMIESSCLSWRAIGIYGKIKTNHFWNLFFWQLLTQTKILQILTQTRIYKFETVQHHKSTQNFHQNGPWTVGILSFIIFRRWGGRRSCSKRRTKITSAKSTSLKSFRHKLHFIQACALLHTGSSRQKKKKRTWTTFILSPWVFMAFVLDTSNNFY